MSLHRFSTMNVNCKVRNMALKVSDEGGMCARDAMYHVTCLNSLYYRCRKKTKMIPVIIQYQKYTI